MADANPPLNEKYLDRIAALRLIDDEFFSEALDGKIAAVQLLVDTILERTDLKVISAKSQATYKSAAGRSIRLDIKARRRAERSSTSRFSALIRMPAPAGPGFTAA